MIGSTLFAKSEENAVSYDVLVRNSVLKTLKYFHVFRHPLYSEEIYKFLQMKVTREALQDTLHAMVRDESIFYAHNMYSLENSGQIFLKRLVGADLAAEKMKEAQRCAGIIAGFPFVKGVYISGSLSKGYADERSDIDFFIVVEEKRLWISRTLLHLFKKLTFLVNRQHSFCMNYFLDESMLCLEEQNIFTATELSTLVPVYDEGSFEQLVKANQRWINEHYPNMAISTETANDVRPRLIKKPMEWLFNKLRPERLNLVLMKLTDYVWRLKWERKNYPMEDYELAMKTKWYVSKQHPLNYQKKILRLNNEDGFRVMAVDI